MLLPDERMQIHADCWLEYQMITKYSKSVHYDSFRSVIEEEFYPLKSFPSDPEH